MSKYAKRKRESNAEDDTDQRPHKTKVVEIGQESAQVPNPENNSGERRQLKSERRKKSIGQRKQIASEKNEVVAEEAGAGQVEDDIASGQDFVSVNRITSSENKKAKGRSPRAIRKEAREGNSSVQNPEEHKSTNSKEPKSDPGARFICFVGNLPYSVTTEQIAVHFAKLQPKAIRLSTDKKTGKCKGFAFLEFDNFDKMKTCLKLYHHSIFDPEQTKNSGEQEQAWAHTGNKGRKINVELTAGGGGGKSAGRRDKIRVKNKKLNEERNRDWEKKKQEELVKSSAQGNGGSRYSITGPNAEQLSESPIENRGDIHPSRLSRVRG